MQLKAISEKCSGCCTCKLACALANFGQVCPTMSALTIRGRFPAPGDYEILLCDQCGACAEVCPVEAIEEKDGVHLVDAEACVECGECVEACPRDVMFEHPNLDAPIKCTLCGECVETCPRDALVLETT